jgi:hypothetical protein
VRKTKLHFPDEPALPSLFAVVFSVCNTPGSILDVIRGQAQAVDIFRKGDDKLMRWSIVFTSSSTLGESPASTFTVANFSSCFPAAFGKAYSGTQSRIYSRGAYPVYQKLHDHLSTSSACERPSLPWSHLIIILNSKTLLSATSTVCYLRFSCNSAMTVLVAGASFIDYIPHAWRDQKTLARRRLHDARPPRTGADIHYSLL